MGFGQSLAQRKHGISFPEAASIFADPLAYTFADPRGKYHAAFEAGTNLVLLAPDVAEVFETPQAVNDALRSLISVAERSMRHGDPSTRKPSARKRTRKSGT